MIDFKELSIAFNRLAAGAVLVSPEDKRYFKVYDADCELVWVNEWDVNCGTASTDSMVMASIGDGEGWKVLP